MNKEKRHKHMNKSMETWMLHGMIAWPVQTLPYGFSNLLHGEKRSILHLRLQGREVTGREPYMTW